MIKSKTKENGITIYHLEKYLTDDKMNKIVNKKLHEKDIKIIINEDADVYNENNQLLLKFRKNVLSDKNVDLFYDNIIHFANKKTSNRGNTTSSKKRNVWNNPKIKSNIFGYYDQLGPRQKFSLKKNNIKLHCNVHPSYFNSKYPEKYKQTLPLIKDINNYYKKFLPTYYKKQEAVAKQTHFKIENTVFTTVTTNINFQTSIHKDKGDYMDGFGNLVVIEKGEYTGSETCFPQYGIGVNVRNNDILFMDVHQYHANLPIKLLNKDSVRLSIVCYLRENIWKLTHNKSKKFFNKYNKPFNELIKI